MKKISGNTCMGLIKRKFSGFSPYWDDYLKRHGNANGLSIQMIPFGNYTVDVIQSGDQTQIKQIFDFVEFLMCNGDEDVQDAIATCYLEYLMSLDPDELRFSSYVKYLGKDSIGYCKAWDNFTGCRTEGLW